MSVRLKYSWMPLAPVGRSRGWLGAGVSLAVALIPLVLAALGSSQGAASAAEVTAFQFGFSSNMLASVNHSDARAAIKVWAQVVARERDISADPDPRILSGVKEISDGLKAQALDAIALTTVEFRELSRESRFSNLFLAVQGGRTNVEHLLLVHRDGPIQDLAGLQGRKLSCYENPRTSLALIWLDTVLRQQALPLATTFFGQVARTPKLSAAVLPVFFRQSDACLVDRLGFDTMCELNPQVGKQLKVVAVSPAFVPMLFCMRPDYTPAIKGRIIDALAQLHTSPAGQQVFTVLQFEKIQTAGISCLDSALEVLAQHDQLTASTGLTNVQRSGGIPQLFGGANP